MKAELTKLPEPSRAYIEKLNIGEDNEMVDTSSVSHAGRLLLNERFSKLMVKHTNENRKSQGKTLGQRLNNQNA